MQIFKKFKFISSWIGYFIGSSIWFSVTGWNKYSILEIIENALILSLALVLYDLSSITEKFLSKFNEHLIKKNIKEENLYFCYSRSLGFPFLIAFCAMPIALVMTLIIALLFAIRSQIWLSLINIIVYSLTFLLFSFLVKNIRWVALSENNVFIGGGFFYRNIKTIPIKNIVSIDTKKEYPFIIIKTQRETINIGFKNDNIKNLLIKLIE